MKKWIPLLCMLCLIVGLFTVMRKKTALPPVPEAEMPVSSGTAEETLPPLPDALLYYGEILDIRKDDGGELKSLSMNSPRDGEWVMNLGEDTHYIDSGARKAFDPGTLQPGDRVYVFHSPMTARTLPPQSPAFAVLRNIPMDASCGMYHQVEEIRREGDWIVTDQGQKVLVLTEDSQVLNEAGEAIDRDSLRAGDYVIAWYFDQGKQVTRASHILLLESQFTQEER